MPDRGHHAGGTTDTRIVDATLALIGERGLGAITMSQVAERAGVARQTLYNHYRDVDSIVAVAVGRHNDESIALLEAGLHVERTPADKIAHMARHFAMVGAHADHALEFGGDTSTEVREVLEVYRTRIEGVVSAVIEEGLRAGDFRADLTPDVDAVLIRSLLDGVRELASSSPDQASEIASRGTQVLLAALS